MDASDDDLFDEEPLELFDQDGPDLFGAIEPTSQLPPSDDDGDDPEIAEPPLAAGRPRQRSPEEITESLMEAVDARRETRGPVTRPDAPLALYRRYRPDTFADVIGQDHVTEPLQRALTNNRVNHAYLFSGPRGCGKTTSARILARALNCARGPAPVPCGECQSCRDLARGGSGSIDVIEIDAASHGGVNEARDLRERAFFAPVHSRYKIYIIDEAHMVTKEGFNALLKVVEEPPPHVKFIFATTEPEKVLGTIRSRTHHYPFRLVPPKTLSGYLASLCEAEGIAVEPAVLPLVVRAGAGSVRDSLSVLDQLLGGAEQSGVTYRQATALLGYTPDALLDEIVDAFAAGDAQGVFAAVDKVIEVGQDPRRFAEDLLRRLRDLIIIAAVPDALSSGLVDVAGDQAERLNAQANAMGAGELTRAAEVIAVGLTEMRGTTAPRLHLELMCARVLLPGADVDGRGVHARLDRLERRLGVQGSLTHDPEQAAPGPSSRGGSHEWSTTGSHPEQALAQTRGDGAIGPGAVTPTPAARTAIGERGATPASSRAAGPTAARDTATPREPATSAASAGPAAAPGTETPPAPATSAAPTEPADPSTRSAGGAPTMGRGSAAPASSRTPAAPPSGAPAAATSAPGTSPAANGPVGTLTTADVRRLWPDVLEEVKVRRRFTWILLSQNAQVIEVRDSQLTLAMANSGARDSFGRGGSDEVLREAILKVIGSALKIHTILDPAAEPAPATPVRPSSTEQQTEREATPGSPGSAEPRSDAVSAVRQNIRPTRRSPDELEVEEEPSRDDVSLDEDTASSDELLVKHLGAELIAEEEG